ncbi:MAG: nucleotidyltransferase domain-containing protein [Verrucomicrobia bacterium]|nr:nucleotidyltransferase domain-containing protein [Verrucomicrobiota bacterium]
MRLSEHVAKVIGDTVRAADPQAQVWLHGSRVDDTARGGDIDILVVSDTLTFHDIVRLRRAILDRIGWQQLDLTVRRRDALDDPFAVLCLSTGLRI